MSHRRSNANIVSANLVDYLVTNQKLSQNDIADVLGVDKSFISRVRKAERDFSTQQMVWLAEHIGVPMGAMLIAARPPSDKPLTGQRKDLADMCENLMRKADVAYAVAQAAVESRRAKR